MGHSKQVENPVVCEGSHFEMGVTQGTQLKGLIANLSRDIRNLEAFQLLRPKWMPYGLYLEIAKFQAKRTFRELDRDYQDYVDRLRGIAQGSGQGVSIICLLNIFESILSDLTETTDVAPLGGCSAVALRGTKVESGGAVIARNFDYLPLIQSCYSLRRCRPKNGFRSLEFLGAPLGGCIDGLNEKGLCITLNYAYVTDKSDFAPPITYAIAKAIATCTNVDEAVQLISNTPRWGGGLVMLADASGEVASLELSNTKATVRKPENGEDFLFHTNVFNCQDMKAVELDQNSRYSEKAPTALRANVLASPLKSGVNDWVILFRVNKNFRSRRISTTLWRIMA